MQNNLTSRCTIQDMQMSVITDRDSQMAVIYHNKKPKTESQTNIGQEMVAGKPGANLQKTHAPGFVPIAVANNTRQRRQLIKTGSEEMVEAMGNIGIGGQVLIFSFADHRLAVYASGFF